MNDKKIGKIKFSNAIKKRKRYMKCEPSKGKWKPWFSLFEIKMIISTTLLRK